MKRVEKIGRLAATFWYIDLMNYINREGKYKKDDERFAWHAKHYHFHEVRQEDKDD